MAPTGNAYNVDWILSTASNAHLANHRAWFVTYKPFRSQASGVIGGTLAIEGIGDVELRVKKPNPKARPSYSIVWLKDVLYSPEAITNQVSVSRLHGSYGIDMSADGGVITKENVPIGVIDSPLLWKLRLSGQAPNHTSLDSNGLYSLSFLWPEEERARWERAKAADLNSEPSSRVPPYTDEEKAWLKQNWQGEFRFLRAHLLHIDKEEDRAEGRRIVRAMMNQSEEDDDNNDDDDNDDDNDDESDEFEISYTHGHGATPIIPHADGHMADYNFSEKELVWIEQNYGNSASFLISYGLKFYNDDDCEEGKAIVKVMMENEE